MAIARGVAILRGGVSIAFVGIASMVVFFWLPYSPLQDLPEWVYQGFVFNEIWSDHAGAGFLLKAYPVPYTFVQLLISGSLVLFSPMMTTKIIVAAYAALALWASHRFIGTHELNRAIAWPVLLCIFVLNSPFWNGYIAYQFGLVIFVFYLSLSPRWRTDIRVLVIFSVLSFFTHGMIYFAFMSAAAAYSLTERRLISFSMAVLPSVLLALWYVRSNVTSEVGGAPVALRTVADFVKYKVYTFMKLGPYQHFSFTGVEESSRLASLSPVLGTVANLLFLVGVVCSFCAAGGRQRWSALVRAPETLIGAGLLCIACVLAPTALGVGNPSERLLYPAFIALSAMAFKMGRIDVPTRTALFANTSVALAIISGFALCSAGLIVAGISYDRSSGRGIVSQNTVANAEAPTADRGRTLFQHRLVQFNDRMRETEREWRTGDAPTLPLVFDTALLRQSRSPGPFPPNR
ncbi:MAG: hypothetical protein M3O26_18870 [Pseudomonadota bacterium]|nr:hypothetical protein [Pseudomonadota bacterium]